jgi:hypothetical protein
MPELIIKYSSRKTLQALTDLAKYFDFEIAKPATGAKKRVFINGVALVSGDETVDISPMAEIFSGKAIDASNLRKLAWQRG